jgi:hypothetical protein
MAHDISPELVYVGFPPFNCRVMVMELDTHMLVG